MKPITWIQLFILCAGIGQAWAVKAQDVRFLSQEKIDSLINPPLMKQGDEILRFEKTVQDIGTLTEDDAPRTCSFTYTNVSKAPDRKSTRLNSSHVSESRMPSSA